MYKKYYKKFLAGHPGVTHLAAHSHHFWPDESLTGMNQCWIDASKLSDHKWDYIFSHVVPKTQGHIAKILKLSHPEQIAIAPNTHELLFRVLSCFFEQEKIKVLTTTSEFHSFRRQINRLSEWDKFEIITIDNESSTFEDDFIQNITKDLDLIFISQVFFNSGQVISNDLIEKIISHKEADTIFCLDGYHSFCALPVDLSKYENDLYYMSGGYKYAQAGEGACFMTVPKSCKLRPLTTGWFASFETLAQDQTTVEYSDSGMRFWGATQDMSGLYRFNAVWDKFFQDGVSIEAIHKHVQKMQHTFLQEFKGKDKVKLRNENSIGHFLTMELKDNQQALAFYEALKTEKILTDFRGNRLRFGFGMYLDIEDIKAVMPTINKIYLENFL